MLLESLLTEMVQTEESAKQHPRKEAARLPAKRPPAVALVAVSEHAERALAPLVAPQPHRLGGGLGKALRHGHGALRLTVVKRESQA
jgi:hypothetical protein